MKPDIAKLNSMNNSDRLEAVLHPDIGLDKAVVMNNVQFFFPVLEREIGDWMVGGYPFKVKDKFDLELNAMVERWIKIAAKAAKFLGIEPNPGKRQWWGVSHLHGRIRELVITDRRNGSYRYDDVDNWLMPEYGRSSLFYTQEEAQSWADMMFGQLRKQAEANGTPCPYKVVQLPPRGQRAKHPEVPRYG